MSAKRIQVDLVILCKSLGGIAGYQEHHWIARLFFRSDKRFSADCERGLDID